MNNRVLEIIENKKLTPSRFADKIGVPRSTISHIISGRNKPSLELISKIAEKYPDINLDWLIKGKGSMISSQTTLFDNTQEKQSEEDSHKSKQISNLNTFNDSLQMETEQKSLEKEKENNKQESSDSEPEQVKKKPVNNEDSEEISNIIIIYNDDSFKIYNPRK